MKLPDKIESQETMPPCPVCGAKPFFRQDFVQGFDFGWGAGCPRYRVNDKLHGHNKDTPSEKHLTAFGLHSKSAAVKWWVKRTQEYANDRGGVNMSE